MVTFFYKYVIIITLLTSETINNISVYGLICLLGSSNFYKPIMTNPETNKSQLYFKHASCQFACWTFAPTLC